jgi:thioredoxin reductase (NADPH)
MQPHAQQPMHTDVLVIGAGPAGLYQAFQLGLLGVSFEVVDALPMAGGQCAALYPDKPIYDIPGIPAINGQALTQQLLAQCSPFMRMLPGHSDLPHAPREHLHLGQVIDALQPPANAQDTFEITSTQGLTWRSRAVVIAGGVGAFVPREWPIPGVTNLHQLSNLHHHLPEASDTRAPPWAGQHLMVAGGGDEALTAVVQLANQPAPLAPAHITLVHRRHAFTATPELNEQVQTLMAQGRVTFVAGIPMAAQVTGERIEHITLTTAEGQPTTLHVDHLLVRLGLSPRMGPITQWGMAMERKQLLVNSSTMATSLPGAYAIGDICTYPGKLRLVACGFHEATLAAHACLAQLYPQACGPLQYTTSSEALLKRLGKA